MVQEVNNKLNLLLKEEYQYEVQSLFGHQDNVKGNSFKSDASSLKLLPELNKETNEGNSNKNADIEDNFKCIVCFKIFKSLVSFKNHMKCLHVQLNCAICKEVFESETEQDNHSCIKQSISKQELDNSNKTEVGSIVQLSKEIKHLQ